MHTGVEKGFDFSCFGSGYDGGQLADIVDLIVATFGDVFFPTSHLPDFGPHLVKFSRSEIDRGIT